jgi:hypothetical protein
MSATSPRAKRPIEIAITATVALFVATSAATQTGGRLLNLLPADTSSVTDYYEQPVYDSTNQKIGTIADLLIDREGQIRAAMITVGGFLGLPSKHVAVPFTALQVIPRERKPHLVLDVTKSSLREARGFIYNLSARRWERAED